MKIKTKRGARRIRNQRVITRRFVTTDYNLHHGVTAGKNYKVLEYGKLLWIDFESFRHYVISPYSPHVSFGYSWSASFKWGVI